MKNLVYNCCQQWTGADRGGICGGQKHVFHNKSFFEQRGQDFEDTVFLFLDHPGMRVKNGNSSSALWIQSEHTSKLNVSNLQVHRGADGRAGLRVVHPVKTMLWWLK